MQQSLKFKIKQEKKIKIVLFGVSWRGKFWNYCLEILFKNLEIKFRMMNNKCIVTALIRKTEDVLSF